MPDFPSTAPAALLPELSIEAKAVFAEYAQVHGVETTTQRAQASGILLRTGTEQMYLAFMKMDGENFRVNKVNMALPHLSPDAMREGHANGTSRILTINIPTTP